MTDIPAPTPKIKPKTRSRRELFFDSDLWWSFKSSKSAMGAAIVLGLVILAAFLAPVLSPQNPYDLAALELWNAELPPVWMEGGQMPYILGTDVQGRDILSGILYGTRISIFIGIASVLVSLVVGVLAGLTAGFYGGWVDNVLMRVGDVLLSIPIILVAILVSSVAQAMLPPELREAGIAVVLVLAIALYSWVQYARVVRAQTMVERRKEYVQASRLVGTPARRLMLKHILPNTLTPVFVAATLNFGLAILIEATLSFLGVGMPPNQPSLGTLIRVGNQYLFSGSWWIVLFPSIQLCILVVAVNMLGDWLRDALNPKLR
ncbi:ABC transporter permease [Aquicoccus porphyridii]|uniref:ABC transporter permease n=1 Tax=Aquicoccus porphyridii TaxID=1852029 RepID=A0A5A9ZFP3_9RHOB|nr:ABC transporter permease [Aquicoccus porphyridii]KAA0916031.1 ABC transporter permease [Aquicoccus porphyridii]RAI52672.1 ABC transporter permease [Rhodobacteraceae bacterium AsT-22]